MFSQFRNVVEGLAQPRPPQAHPRRSNSIEHPSPSRPLAERPAKVRLEDRLRASFTIGEASNPSTPAGSSRVSPVPQFVEEHPLSVDHPLSPAAIPLPTSPPPNGLDYDSDPLHLDTPLTLPATPDIPDNSVSSDSGSYSMIEPEPINHSTPSILLSEDSPVTSQVPEQSPDASEEDTEMHDATQSTSTPEDSHSEDNESLSASAAVEETTHTNQDESGEVPMPTEQSQSEHSASADVESLREQLRLMEQRFTGL